MKKVFYVLLAMTALSSGKAFGQGKTNLAVYVYGSAGEETKKLVAQRFIATIVRSDKYAAVERTDDFLAELRRELGYQYSGNVDDGQIIRLGKQFGVKMVCVVEVGASKGGGGYRYDTYNYIIASRMVDIETGLVVSAAGEYDFSLTEWEGYNGTRSFKRAGGKILYEEDGYDARTNGLIDITNKIVAKLLQGVTATQGKQKIAIYVTKSSYASDAKRVNYRLIENITISGIFITVDRTSDFLAELKYQSSGNVEDSQLSRLGRQFGVNLVCVIDITSIYTTMRVINVETGLIVATAENKSSSKVDEMTAELLQQLTPFIPCTKKDQRANQFVKCCDGLTNVNGVCRDLATFCTKKDQRLASDFNVCCNGLFNINGVCRDYPCAGIRVAAADFPDRYKWKKAMEACPAGWRLPTRSELECLCKNYKATGLKDYTIYWSSTEYDKSNAYYYYLTSYYFSESNSSKTEKTDKLRVRCVKDR